MTTQKKISALTELTAANTTDVVPIVDNSGQSGVTKRITVQNAFKSVPAGQAATPGLAFAGDVDTGISRVGADQLALCTGGQARLTVGATGDITIGSNLIVDGTTTTISSETLLVEDKNIELGTVASPSDTTADGGGITLKGATDKTIKWISSTGAWTFNQPISVTVGSGTAKQTLGSSAVSGGSYTNYHGASGTKTWFVGSNYNVAGALEFWQSTTNGGTTPGSSPAMMLDSLGNLGIGTASPKRHLHINGGDETVKIQLTNSTTGSSTDGEGFQIGIAADGTANLEQRENADLVFYTNNSPRMSIASDGNVGIGETDPYYRLHVEFNNSDTSFSGGSAGNWGGNGIRIENTNTNGNTMALAHFRCASADWHIGTKYNSSDNSDFCFFAETNERLRIKKNGTVLIGGTSTADDNHANIDANGTLTVRRASATDDAIVVKEGSTSSFLVDADGFVANFNVGSSTTPVAFAAYDNELGVSGPYAAMGAAGGEAVITAGSTASDNVPLVFRTANSGTEASKAQLSHLGYFSAGGWWTNDKHRLNGNDATQGTHFCTISGYQSSGGSTQDTMLFYAVNASGTANSSASAIKVYRNDTTLRSINAAGTVNTSGNDYAEYMVKAGDFTLAKGDICGINAQGKLTNVFADAVAFAVKSTDPSYVGGDTWSASLGEEPGGYSDTRTEEEIAAAKVAYQENLEAVRQTVDRIAFSGQVPVNVTGTTPGQHIIPTANEDGSISGIAKSEADLTLAEYMSSVGKVIAVEDDGRAKIIVKVA